MIQCAPPPTPSPTIPPPPQYFCQGTSSTCTILCNATNPCNNIRINASLASILNLTCIAPHACENLQIVDGPTNQATIHCSYNQSCKNATFNVNSTAGFVNVECMQGDSKSEAYSCYKAKLIADTASNVDVLCAAQNCVGMDFHIQYVENAIFMINEGAANNANIYANNVQNELQVFCTDSYACQNASIYAQGMTQLGTVLNVTCLEINACRDTQIYP